MVIGGAMGAIVGLAFQLWMPTVVTRIDIFVILGMAGFFAASANTPVSTLIMISEITGSYALMLPSMWVCALAYLLSRGWSLYRHQVPSRVDSPAHRGELIVDVLAGVKVRDAWEPSDDEEMVTIPRDMTLSDVAVKVASSRQNCFPVVDEEGRMCGYFSLEDVRYFLYDREAGRLAKIRDIAATDVEPLTLQVALATAMDRFAQSSYDELPIVEADSPGRVIGLLGRRRVITIYRANLARIRAEGA